jgi:hypothetical protein
MMLRIRATSTVTFYAKATISSNKSAIANSRAHVGALVHSAAKMNHRRRCHFPGRGSTTITDVRYHQSAKQSPLPYE